MLCVLIVEGLLTIVFVSNVIKNYNKHIEIMYRNLGVLDNSISDLYDILLGEDEDDMKGYE